MFAWMACYSLLPSIWVAVGKGPQATGGSALSFSEIELHSLYPLVCSNFQTDKSHCQITYNTIFHYCCTLVLLAYCINIRTTAISAVLCMHFPLYYCVRRCAKLYEFKPYVKQVPSRHATNHLLQFIGHWWIIWWAHANCLPLFLPRTGYRLRVR